MASDAGSGGAKTAAAARPEFLMDAILPTIKKAHIDALETRLEQDVPLRYALMHNDATLPFIAKLAEAHHAQPAGQTGEGMIKSAAYGIKPKVVQIQKIAGGFRIKTANPEALIPTADDVDRPAAVGALGGDLVSAVERDGTTTITTQPAVKETLEDLTIKVVNEFGLYKVKAQGEGTELVVLSACETAQGSIDYGEGVYGLARALRIAGAGQVLLTLWPVRDIEARDFMVAFYNAWLSQTSGSDPAAALRQTRLAYMQSFDPRLRNPRVWAPYVLIGG